MRLTGCLLSYDDIVPLVRFFVNICVRIWCPMWACTAGSSRLSGSLKLSISLTKSASLTRRVDDCGLSVVLVGLTK